MKDSAYLIQNLGCGFYSLKSVDSTNNFAKKMFLGSELAVFADSQTEGRGRQGHSFYSPEGGIYFSWAVPEKAAAHPGLLTVKAAVCVLQALEKLTGKKYAVKWVNDIFLGDRKVCGILCEYCPGNEYGSREGFYVCGVGINTSSEGFPAELQELAGGIGEIDRAELICEVINALRKETDPVEIVKIYGQKSYLTGKEVSYVLNGEAKSGRVLGVNASGNLRVLSGDTEDVLSAGEVSVKRV